VTFDLTAVMAALLLFSIS